MTTTPSAAAPAPSPAPSPTLSLAGTWTGTLTTANRPDRQIPLRSWVAAQTGTAVTGPLLIVPGDGVVSSTLAGTVSGSQLTSVTFTVPAQAGGLPPGCSFSGTGTLTATASSVSGSLAMTFQAACVGDRDMPASATNETWTISLSK